MPQAESIYPDRERISLGVPGLDDILNGGLPSGHLYLIEGDPGTGKTTIALQFLLEGQRIGEKGLHVTLSESNAELLAVAESHGWSLGDLSIYEMTPEESSLNPEEQYTVFHPSEVELADTLTAVLKHVEAINPKRIVFDSLAELRMLSRDPLRYRRQVLALKRYFNGRDCTVLLLDDSGTDGRDMQLRSIAHGVIILQSLDRDYGVKRRRLEVRKLRGSRYREGFHDFNMYTGGIAVIPRLVASEHKPGFQPHVISSGLAELDQLIGGGIDAGTSTLIMGPAGCGKSSVAIRYALAAARRGDAATIFAFDESIASIKHRAAGLGMDLEPYIQSGHIHLQQIDPAELSPGEFVAAVQNAVEKLDAAVLVIDSINGLLASMPDDRFLALQLHELLTYLSQQGVATILTIAQHGLLGSNMDSPIDVSYLADAVVLCRYFEYKGELRKAISVMKKRSGTHERSIRELIMENNEMRVGGTLSEFEGVLTGIPRFTGVHSDLVKGEDDLSAS